MFVFFTWSFVAIFQKIFPICWNHFHLKSSLLWNKVLSYFRICRKKQQVPKRADGYRRTDRYTLVSNLLESFWKLNFWPDEQLVPWKDRFLHFHSEPYKHTTCILFWNDMETTVSTSFPRGIHAWRAYR